MNVATLYEPGELGQRVNTNDGKVHQIVVCDSGPSSVAVGDVAFWKNRLTYQVTNKQADAAEGRNAVAGMFEAIVTPGNYCSIQISGRGNVKCGATPSIGDAAVAKTGTGSDLDAVAQGTAPTCVVFGVYAGTVSSGKALVDITVGTTNLNP